jgi:hypothetical protein
MAWHVAMLGRIKDMPRLDDLMGIEPEEIDEAAEAERQLAVLRKWQAADRIMAAQQGKA